MFREGLLVGRSIKGRCRILDRGMGIADMIPLDALQIIECQVT